MATYSNLTIDQGSTFSFTIDLDNLATGADATLTSHTGHGSIRKSHGSSTRSAAFTIVGTQSGASTFTGADKGLNVSLTATQTGNLKAGRYVYDIEIRSGSTVTRVLEGQVEVTPRVTLSTE